MNMKEPEMLSVKKRLASELASSIAFGKVCTSEILWASIFPPMICTYTIGVRVNRKNMGKYHMSYKVLPIIIVLLFKYLVEPNIK